MFGGSLSDVNSNINAYVSRNDIYNHNGDYSNGLATINISSSHYYLPSNYYAKVTFYNGSTQAYYDLIPGY